jgi:hypothetical protein
LKLQNNSFGKKVMKRLVLHKESPPIGGLSLCKRLIILLPSRQYGLKAFIIKE